MSLNVTEIGQVVSSLNLAVLGAKIQEVISEQDPGQITLVLRFERSNHFLRFALTPRASRFGRISGKPKAAPVPHPFVMLLRREIIGKRIVKISQINNDRVVHLVCQQRETEVTLVLELIAGHANLFLTDSNLAIQGAFLKNRSEKRNLSAGYPYQPPATQNIDPQPSRFESGDTLEAEIDKYYRTQITTQQASEKQRIIEKMVRSAQKKTTRLISKLENDLTHAETGEQLQQHGHILKMHLSKIKKGDTVLEGKDFNNNPITIPLAPGLSPVANMESMFGKAKRLIRAVSQIEERLLTTMSESEELDTILESIRAADEIQLDRIKARLIRRYPYLMRIANQRNTTTERLPYREFLICQNRIARVGRSAKDNDALTLRHSRPNDLWLHVRQETGSHVIVPLDRNETPTPALLVDAAHLAVHFSKSKNDTDVEVIYTPRKYVQKPKGAAPGSVRLLREKTIFLKVEPARLKRILSDSKSSI